MSFYDDLHKYKPRKEQKEALEFIKHAYEKDNDIKFFLLDLPVGTGKSFLTMMITDWYRKTFNRHAKVDVITNSKLLQDQYTYTYDSINDLKGQENYFCEQYGCSCKEGKEFAKLNKTKCENCPYDIARESFIGGGLSLTNFYLYILYSIYIPTVLEKRGAEILIVDEAHTFDDVLSNFISIKITERIIKKFDFKNEYSLIKSLNKINQIEDYVSLLSKLNTEILDTRDEIERNLTGGKASVIARTNTIDKIIGDSSKDMKLMKLLTDLDQLQSKILFFIEEYKKIPENWVMEKSYNEKDKKFEHSLEPIWSYDYLKEYVFDKYEMVFLMSGTILDKNLFCWLNGLDTDKAVYHSIKSPFKIKNRPIYYIPVGKMTYTKKEETFKKYKPFIKKILKKYEKKKGLIHTNSFELQQWIKRDIKDGRLVYHDSSDKDEVLHMHKESLFPSVIVSPSMSTGVSFDDDYARFQIIAKVPYPSLASQKNKMRQKVKPEWYAWATVSEISQMCGRIVRNYEDYGDTIIIDESFGDVMRYSSSFMPLWFQESIKALKVTNA